MHVEAVRLSVTLLATAIGYRLGFGSDLLTDDLPGLLGAARAVAEGDDPEDVAAAAEFVLEGLVARRAIARSEERGYHPADPELVAGAAPRRRWN